MAYSSFIILTLLFASVFAVVVKIRSCPNVDEALCSVSEVRIDPCPNYKDVCVFKRKDKINASLSFDFTPNFETSNLETNVYWDNGLAGDIPFPDMGSTNGCDYTTCPTVPGKLQVFNYNLPIGRRLSKGNFEFKWKVWDKNNLNNVCCYETFVKIMS